MDVVVLAGGLGTRLRRVLPDTPKPLAPVAGRPFVAWVLDYLAHVEPGLVYLSTGYLAERFAAFVRDAWLHNVSCVAESGPMGTAGGFLNVVGQAQTVPDAWLVCNGDSLVMADLRPMLDAWRADPAAGALVGVEVEDAARYGTLDVAADGTLRGFREKQPGAGPINAGIYLFPHAWTSEWSSKRPLSFEFDVFPALLAQGRRLHVHRVRAPFLDIGTEASYEEAEQFILRNPHWFASARHENERPTAWK